MIWYRNQLSSVSVSRVISISMFPLIHVSYILNLVTLNDTTYLSIQPTDEWSTCYKSHITGNLSPSHVFRCVLTCNQVLSLLTSLFSWFFLLLIYIIIVCINGIPVSLSLMYFISYFSLWLRSCFTVSYPDNLQILLLTHPLISNYRLCSIISFPYLIFMILRLSVLWVINSHGVICIVHSFP